MSNLRVSAVHRKLHSWDLSDVRTYLMHKDGLDIVHVLRLEEEYRRYISLCLGSDGGRQLPISPIIDTFWHAHILFTRDYVAMSQMLGVGYFHHAPSRSEAESQRIDAAYEAKTIPLYVQHFGEPDPTLWPRGISSCERGCDNCRNKCGDGSCITQAAN